MSDNPEDIPEEENEAPSEKASAESADAESVGDDVEASPSETEPSDSEEAPPEVSESEALEEVAEGTESTESGVVDSASANESATESANDLLTDDLIDSLVAENDVGEAAAVAEEPAFDTSAFDAVEPEAVANSGDGSQVLDGADSIQRVRRLMQLGVTVSVRLAEKKIDLGQLLEISPGALLVFNKPCDDFLDMYVNNQPYCRGEAVKIGENFGLKVTEIGVDEIRDTGVLNF